MKWEQRLRRLSVAQRLGIFLVVVLLPLVALSVVSVAVLNQQEADFSESVEESVTMLLTLRRKGRRHRNAGRDWRPTSATG